MMSLKRRRETMLYIIIKRGRPLQPNCTKVNAPLAAAAIVTTTWAVITNLESGKTREYESSVALRATY